MTGTPFPPPERGVLHEFVVRHREAIITRARQRTTTHPGHAGMPGGLDHGVPLFLTQLSETLKHEADGGPVSPNAIGDSAARHGAELLSQGFTASEVVHTYGDICQALTEIAVEQSASISTGEFHTLNRCLDTAMARAVTEHARLTAHREAERLGQVAHEIRNHLNAALLAFDSFRRGIAGINGGHGAVLGRNLLALRDVVESTLTDIRMETLPQHRETLYVAVFLGDIAASATLHAEYRRLTFTLAGIDAALVVNADPYLLRSAVTNLLHNAFKFTPEGGHILLGASSDEGCVRISVQDECGGIPEGAGDPFQAFESRGGDRTGLGLGLSIARKAVRSHGGDITVRNMPEVGCVFTIELPIVTPGGADRA